MIEPQSDAFNPVDIHVGRRLRLCRRLRGLSQKELGDKLNLSFQQVQKFESGANRIGASRLWQIAKKLDAPISYFFAGLEETHNATDALKSELDLIDKVGGCDMQSISCYLRLPSKVRGNARILLMALYNAYASDEDFKENRT